jgi:hypothetical protein
MGMNYSLHHKLHYDTSRTIIGSWDIANCHSADFAIFRIEKIEKIDNHGCQDVYLFSLYVLQ